MVFIGAARPAAVGGPVVGRYHASLRHSVSTLAIICAIGCAAFPPAAAAQTVTASQTIAGVGGGAGTDGSHATGGAGGGSGNNANSGGGSDTAAPPNGYPGAAGSGAGGSGGQGGIANGGTVGGYSSGGGGAGAVDGGAGGGGVNGAAGGGGVDSGAGGGGGGGGLGDAGFGGGGGGGYNGGGGGGGGGVGLTAASNLSNSGSILGGIGGNAGNAGTGNDGGGGGGGGAGVYAAGAYSLSNVGTIGGGAGGAGGTGNGGDGGGGGGGDGLAGSGFNLSNGGGITGGSGGGGGGGGSVGGGGGAGADGIAGTDFLLTNTGSITGGSGGDGGIDPFGDGSGGAGGAGIFGSGFSVTNSGNITGSNGGTGGAGSSLGGGGGAGGAGIAGSGFTLSNTGTITGGTGGGGVGVAATTGLGGAGVVSTGGATVDTSGAIDGGLSGGGVQADAIDFSGGGNTLVLEPGYSFVGNVVSTSATTNGGDTLALGGAGSGTFDLSGVGTTGEFQGFNDLAKTGAGTWIVDNDASFATTTVEAGTLEVGDAADAATVLTSAVSVDSGATLRGHGSIDGDVTNDGTVFPGGSIGTLTINGNYTQNSDGTLNIEITPSTIAGTGYDQLVVSGTASLAGTLAVQVDNGTYTVGSLYDLLHADGGVTGRFATVGYSAALAAYLTPTVTYSADDVTLQLTPTPATPPVTTPVTTTTPATPTTPSLSNALAFSSGRIYAAGNFAQDGAVLNVLSAALGSGGGTGIDAGDAVDQGYWLHGLGAFGQANGFDFNEKGFVLGKGFVITPNFVMGGAISNVYTATTGGDSRVDGNSFGALLYGIYTEDRLTVSATAGAGHLGADLSRGLPTLDESAKASSNGAFEAAALSLQYQLMSGNGFFITPYATASYLHTGVGTAQETGAGILDLRYDAVTTSLAELGAGITGGLHVPVEYGTLTGWGSLGGEGTLGNPRTRVVEVLGTYRAGESALAAPVGAFTPAAGFTLSGQGPWSVSTAWGGQFGSAASAENFTLEARYVW